MATYKQIRGIQVQARDSDPTVVEGDVWYNATTSVLKMYSYAAGSWATSDDINTARSESFGAGTNTASILWGGGGPKKLSEEYDGSSWAEGDDLNAEHVVSSGFGIQTACIFMLALKYRLLVFLFLD